MESVNEFVEALKEQLIQRGITDVNDPRELAQNFADIYEQKVINNENCLPFFGEEGNAVDPNSIDHDYETLDFNFGVYQCSLICS